MIHIDTLNGKKGTTKEKKKVVYIGNVYNRNLLPELNQVEHNLFPCAGI